MPRALALALALAAVPACGDDGDSPSGSDGSSSGEATTSPGSTGDPTMTSVGSTGSAGDTTNGTSTGPDPDSSDGGTTGGSDSGSDGGTDSGTDDGTGTGSDSGSDGDSGSDSGSGGQMMVNMSITMSTFSGMPVPDGDLCTAAGCSPYTNSVATFDLPQFSDTEFWVETPGLAETHFQFSTFDQDLNYNVTTSADAEQAFLVGLFGAALQPGMGHIAQRVVSNVGVTPTIDTPAEGPYYLNLDGTPDPMGTSTATTPGGGYYIFLNVAPGDHTISLPGCDEADEYWGPDSDEEIDVTAYADATVALFSLTCP